MFEVYRALHNVWDEKVYEKALHIALTRSGLKAERQKEYEVLYKMRRVGHYFIDILVENEVVLELKATPVLTPLHQAQLISYLKGYRKPIGILVNFGAEDIDIQILPNKLDMKTPLYDNFNFEKLQTPNKAEIKDVLEAANTVLITMGAGYFHHIYQRALFLELQQARIPFHLEKQVAANYENQTLATKSVNFFVVRQEMLLSAVAVQELDTLILSKFKNYMKYFGCSKGLIVNFNAVCLRFNYLVMDGSV